MHSDMRVILLSWMWHVYVWDGGVTRFLKTDSSASNHAHLGRAVSSRRAEPDVLQLFVVPTIYSSHSPPQPTLGQQGFFCLRRRRG